MIELRKVGITYPGGVVGLYPTSLVFHRRQFTVLLGLSGAGKSTLLRSLNLLAAPTQGEIVVDGVGMLTHRRTLRRHRQRTAIIFQQHQLIGRYTALHNVLMARLARYPSWRTLFPLPEGDRLLALESLGRVGLVDKALARVDTLSGGQQQRVGIARALAQEPELILADEPVASLDPATSRDVLSQLHDVCKQDGLPAVVSLHQLELARCFADRIIGLSGGSVVFDGPPGHLTDRVVAQIYGKRLPAASASPSDGDAPNDVSAQMEAFG